MSQQRISEVARHQTGSGLFIYSIPVTVFERFRANLYLVDHPEGLILIDTGSGLEESNSGIQRGLEAIEKDYGRRFLLPDIQLILITHGHIDHFGGLPFLGGRTGADVWVHPRDSRILGDFSRRVEGTLSNLSRFLREAGVAEADRHSLLEVYRWGKDHYQSQDVRPALREGRLEPFGFEVFHAPGHCPGQVCIRAEDILFTGDHVLSRISPHLAPESITPGTGLRIYLESLHRIAGLPGVKLALGGHEAPMTDLAQRCREIESLHQRRLKEVARICRQPSSLQTLSRRLFGKLQSYHILLGLEEAGALVEYLAQEGRLQSEIHESGTRLYHGM